MKIYTLTVISSEGEFTYHSDSVITCLDILNSKHSKLGMLAYVDASDSPIESNIALIRRDDKWVIDYTNLEEAA